MKGKINFLMLFGGITLTGLLFFKLCDDSLSVKSILLDILAMLGSGVFCSAIVSLIIEKQNKKAIKKMREEQTQFVLRSAQRSIINLFRYELRNLSGYYADYVLKEKRTLTKKELTFKEIGDEIVRLINEIKNFESECLNSGGAIITPETIKRDEDKSKTLARNPRPYYESIYEKLQSITSNSSLYLVNDIFDKKEIAFFDTLTWDVQGVLNYDTEMHVYDGTLLEFKLCLYEQTEDIISKFHLENSKEIVYMK